MDLENADNTLRYRKALPSHHDLDKYDLTTRLIPPPPPDSRLINRILNATATSSSNTSGQNTALASPQHLPGSQSNSNIYTVIAKRPPGEPPSAPSSENNSNSDFVSIKSSLPSYEQLHTARCVPCP
jgi:hypothetical protein